MNDQRLGELLRELPREHARQGFTSRVLARLDETPAPRRRAWLQPAMAAALLLVLAAIPLAIQLSRPRGPDRAEAARILRELRAEHELLERELERISPPAPVLYLGGDENVQLILDVSRVPRAETAAYRPEDF